MSIASQFSVAHSTADNSGAIISLIWLQPRLRNTSSANLRKILAAWLRI